MDRSTRGNGESAAHLRWYLRGLPAQQQPEWGDHNALGHARLSLERSAPLVTESEIADLRNKLRAVAAGDALILQTGDCAEPVTDTSADVVERKAQALHTMSGVLEDGSGLPVIQMGRIAGQFAKPRSKPHEDVGGELIPSYRGPAVNDPHPSADAREHRPERLVIARKAAGSIAGHLRSRRGDRVWTSHEALVLDYELPQIQQASDGRPVLTSAHTVWVGARTNQLDHAHVALIAGIANPVGCKVSPDTSPEQLVAIARAVDPDREPGRLMLIARMGAAAERLSALMAAVKSAGHPAIWICDPMHGNTVTASDGRKTRYLPAIIRELNWFQYAADSTGVIAGGIHLETTVDAVRECLDSDGESRDAADSYTTLCDPRLTLQQAVNVLSHWKIGASR